MVVDMIERLWSTNDGKDWMNALEKYWDGVKPSNMELEKWMDKLDSGTVAAMSINEFYEFLYSKYFVWKYTAPNRLATTRRQLLRYIENDELEDLRLIKDKLFKCDRQDTRRALKIANGIRGQGSAGASGLLAVLFPDYFGTVDQFVVKNLQ